jgi:heptosyltransferase II
MRILIELPTWLGDAVMTTPAIENLANFFNDSEIILMGSPVAIEALKNHPKVTKTFILEKKYFNLYKTLKSFGKFDLFFSFRGSFRSTILKLFISSKDKFQFNRIRYLNRHQVEKYNDFICESLGINILAGKLIVYPNSKFSKNNKKPIVGINPGASYGDSKRWHSKKFAQVAAALSHNYEILIFGGPNEEAIAADIESLLVKMRVSNFRNLAGKTSIQELIARISSLDLFISGDSGPMHLAASFQVPTVAIFGPTRDDETSQWMNSRGIIVKKNLDCQPCMKRTCPLKHHDCMNLIKVEDILKAVQSLN